MGPRRKNAGTIDTRDPEGVNLATFIVEENLSNRGLTMGASGCGAECGGGGGGGGEEQEKVSDCG